MKYDLFKTKFKITKNSIVNYLNIRNFGITINYGVPVYSIHREIILSFSFGRKILNITIMLFPKMEKTQ